MAVQGYYSQLVSTSTLLEVKRAGKEHQCSGLFVRQGQRPGKLKDLWVIGKSKRCLDKIPIGQFYIANKIIPTDFMSHINSYDRWIPTCPVCAIESYPEHFDGSSIANYMKRITPEVRKEIAGGLAQILTDLETVV